MNDFLENLYGTLFHPKRTFEKLAVSRRITQSLIVYIIVSIMTAAAGIVDMPEGFPPEILPIMPGFITIGIVVGFVLWFVKAGFLQLLAEIMGGQGRALNLLGVLGFAALPGIFNGPIALITRNLAPYLSIPFSLLLYIWTTVLTVIAVRAVHRISTGRSVFVTLLPLLIFMAVIVFIVIAAIATFAPMLQGIFEGV